MNHKQPELCKVGVALLKYLGEENKEGDILKRSLPTDAIMTFRLLFLLALIRIAWMQWKALLLEKVQCH